MNREKKNDRLKNWQTVIPNNNWGYSPKGQNIKVYFVCEETVC